MAWAIGAFLVVVVLIPDGGWLTFVLGALAASVAYLLESRWYAEAPCRRCNGNPRTYNAARSAWHSCGACGGSGRRRRLFAGRP